MDFEIILLPDEYKIFFLYIFSLFIIIWLANILRKKQKRKKILLVSNPPTLNKEKERKIQWQKNWCSLCQQLKNELKGEKITFDENGVMKIYLYITALCKCKDLDCLVLFENVALPKNTREALKIIYKKIFFATDLALEEKNFLMNLINYSILSEEKND